MNVRSQHMQPWQTFAVCAAAAIWMYSQLFFGFSICGPELLGEIHTTLAWIGGAAVIALLLAVIASQTYLWSPRTAALIAIALGVVFLSYVRSGEEHPLYALLFIVAAVKVDIRTIARVYVAMSLAVFASVLLVDTFGPVWSVWAIPNTTYACGYGFGHPNNVVFLLVSTLVSMTLAYDRKKTYLLLAFACLVTAVVSFVFLSCRTGAILMAGLAVALVIEQKAPVIVRLVESPRVFAVMPIALLTVIVGVLVLLFGPLYGTELEKQINTLISGRVWFVRNAYDLLGGYTLFGRNVIGIDIGIVDCCYARYLLINGIAVMVVLYAWYARAMVVIGRRNPQFIVWVCMIVYLLYFILEAGPAAIFLNCTLFYMSAAIPTMDHGAASETAGRHLVASTS